MTYLDLDSLLRVGCDVSVSLSAAESEYDEEPTAAGPLARLYENIMRVLLAVSAPPLPLAFGIPHQFLTCNVSHHV